MKCKYCNKETEIILHTEGNPYCECARCQEYVCEDCYAQISTEYPK